MIFFSVFGGMAGIPGVPPQMWPQPPVPPQQPNPTQPGICIFCFTNIPNLNAFTYFQSFYRIIFFIRLYTVLFLNTSTCMLNEPDSNPVDYNWIYCICWIIPIQNLVSTSGTQAPPQATMSTATVSSTFTQPSASTSTTAAFPGMPSTGLAGLPTGMPQMMPMVPPLMMPFGEQIYTHVYVEVSHDMYTQSFYFPESCKI